MKKKDTLVEMTTLPKTWILDLDGTIVKHNGYKTDGIDSLLPGTDRLLDQIKDGDMVIIVTSRSVQYRELTEKFLSDNHIRYDSIIYEAPYGERILINDRKPSGRDMAFAFNIDRDIACAFEIRENESL